MIQLEVTGDTEVVAKLDAMPGRLHAALEKRLTATAYRMENVIKQKLSGRVLNVRSGNLRDSIFTDVKTTPTSVTATVSSSNNVKYGRIQEYGGTTRPHVIEAKTGGVLAFQKGGKAVFARRVNHPGSRIPARPFMRPTLAEFRDRIIASINEAAAEAAR